MGFAAAAGVVASVATNVATSEIEGAINGSPSASGGGGSGESSGQAAFANNTAAIAGEQKLNFNTSTSSPISSGATAQASDGIDRSAGNPLSYGSKMRMSMLGTTADPWALASKWSSVTG